jgi:hypothetical protein
VFGCDFDIVRGTLKIRAVGFQNDARSPKMFLRLFSGSRELGILI